MPSASRTPAPPLAAALFSFSHLAIDEALRTIAALGFTMVDVGVFPDRHHIRTAEVMEGPAAAAGRLRTLLDANRLSAGDVFLHPGSTPEDVAANHPDPAVAAEAERRFEAALAFAAALGAGHLTALPGANFGNPESDAKRAARMQSRWLARAGDAGIRYAVEPHLGSIAESPGKCLAFLERVPGLGLTLDPSHFVCGGHAAAAIAPLHRFASWTHVRPARRGKLQCPIEDSEFDCAAFVRTFRSDSGIRHTLEVVAGKPPLCDPVDIAGTIRLLALALSPTP